MIKVNSNFNLLPANYLFAEVARKVKAFKESHPDVSLIRMGIGDVTRPLCEAAINAMKEAVTHLSDTSTFHGYGPETGYRFLIENIIEHDYRLRGVNMDYDEIFISDGAKSDTGHLGDILSPDCKIALTDPVYPVYVDTNVMEGRAGSLGTDGRWSNIIYLPTLIENDFIPALPTEVPDVIYLCYPNNPTGTALTREELAVWVEYARQNNVLIIFDGAYEAYISRPEVPHSIYEIPGAKEVAIEVRSYSKTAGFTGVRCGYTVVPKELKGRCDDGTLLSLNDLWRRQQTTKFNGASYIAQCGAAALYLPSAQHEIKATIAYYMTNATKLRNALNDMGLKAVGGIDSPYVWVKTPGNMTSWQFFDHLLVHANVVGTPGSGFGPSGEGYFRFTGFATSEDTDEAINRIKKLVL